MGIEKINKKEFLKPFLGNYFVFPIKNIKKEHGLKEVVLNMVILRSRELVF